MCVLGEACVCKKSKKCKTPMGSGGKCNIDRFWIFDEGQVCVNIVYCISDHGVCMDQPTQCLEALACVGIDGIKQCTVFRQIGETCGSDPFSNCELNTGWCVRIRAEFLKMECVQHPQALVLVTFNVFE